MEDTMGREGYKKSKAQSETNKWHWLSGEVACHGEEPSRTGIEVGVSMEHCQDEEAEILGAVRLCWQAGDFVGVKICKALNSK